VFERLIREFGSPLAIRTDNGVPFASPHALFGEPDRKRQPVIAIDQPKWGHRRTYNGRSQFAVYRSCPALRPRDDMYRLEIAEQDCSTLGAVCWLRNLPALARYFGIHSWASFCASSICAGVSLVAAKSRVLIATSRLSFSEAGNRDAARVNHLYAST